jgi:hypothetical protein
MPVVMLVKCEKCGYENFPQHRYCGMCAAPLRIPGVATAPPSPPPPIPVPQHAAPKYEERPVTPATEVASRQVSGPSFLGLGQEAPEDKSFSYLLEDEPSHRGRNLVLVLLIAAAAAAVWYWHQDLRAVADRLLNTLPAATKPAASDKTASNPPAPATTDTVAGGASSNSPNIPPEPDGNASSAQTPPAQTTTPATADAAAASPPAESSKTGTTLAGSQPPAANQSPTESASAKSSPSHKESAEISDSDETPSAPPPARKPAATKAVRATAAASREDDLEALGEKYLYGNGVPENCTRARTNLMAAAEHSNAQAESVLGTMYATGHCATRDLPTAYRWFGRSLRQDPKNTRIEQDLQVLWNQMTPGERQLAMKSEH